MSLELRLAKAMASMYLSPSHDFTHLNRVLAFARSLTATYGGDEEVLIAASYLHDLGRGDEEHRHGEDSVMASRTQAEVLLERIGFPEPKKEAVLLAILEHDKPGLSPSSTEGKILKDADFLAGFGPWGILRIAMWAGETGRDFHIVLDRLMHGMKRRYNSLEFELSRQYARSEILFLELFLARLARETDYMPWIANGHYIVLEGISGGGKNTQAELLRDKLRAAGRTATVISEPDGAYHLLREAWERHYDESLENEDIREGILLADRFQQMRDIVEPEISNGKDIVSVRNYLSSLVYQGDGMPEDTALLAFRYRNIPQPELLLLLDLPPVVALERIKDRTKHGLYESPESLERHRTLYMSIGQRFFAERLEIIDASAEIEIVAGSIWEKTQQRLGI